MTTVPVVRFVVAGVESDQCPEGCPYTVVYDGACNVCQRIVRRLNEWDRRGTFETIPSQAPGVHARFPWIPIQAYRESVQLIGPGGETWQGAAAIEKILDLLPKGRFVSWIFRIPFVRPLADRFYRWFARNRYKLGCGEHCQYRPLEVDHGDAVPNTDFRDAAP
jgi:predicted DCC family thiol-disulfide oxidoreductase YuxK